MTNKESSEYDKSGVSSKGAETALSGLLKHVLPTRQFSERYPLAADIGYFANVVDLGNGQGIAFGTDGREMWEVFIELENMVDAGMMPADVIISATGISADLLNLEDVGTIEAGKLADFIVLNDNPLEDIKNIRQIDSVYLRGTKLESTNK